MSGFAIVRHVTRVLTRSYRSNLGYKRDDPSTLRSDKLPIISEKGMIMHYGISHEQFVWDVRAEPGVVGAFEK